jgi:hypothetical protein
MSFNELISKLESMIAELKYVKAGEYVYATHVNVFVDWLTDALTVCRDLYEKFKAKTGKTLPNTEYWLNLAEVRIGLMRKVKFGDFVFPRDHNLIIDTFKPLELALREMEENL